MVQYYLEDLWDQFRPVGLAPLVDLVSLEDQLSLVGQLGQLILEDLFHLEDPALPADLGSLEYPGTLEDHDNLEHLVDLFHPVDLVRLVVPVNLVDQLIPEDLLDQFHLEDPAHLVGPGSLECPVDLEDQLILVGLLGQ